jgi:hypothetical protein
MALVAFAFSALALPARGEDTKLDQAQQKKEAKTLFTQGVKLAESGDSRGALVSFRSAYEKFANFRVLYNIGQLCSRLADPVCAVRAYDQYLSDGGSDIPAKRRGEVDLELQNLRRVIATITINVSVPGPEVTFDDAVVGRAPLGAPVLASPGSHKIAVTHEGKTVDRTIKVAAGEAIAVDLELPREPSAVEAAAVAASVPEEPPPRPAPPRRPPVPVVPWVVTGGFAVATAVTGILAATSYSSFDAKRNSFPITREALDDTQSTARTYLLMTGLFGTLTIASAAVAGYFTFLAPSRAPRAQVGDSRLREGLRLSLGPRGFLLMGTLP